MRIVTRPDMDGLTCAVLLRATEEIEDVCLVHPQEISDRRFEVVEGDILANLPYHPDCSKWFDHHQHTATPATPPPDFDGVYGLAPSAARLVYDYYGGRQRLPQFEELVAETDRVDSADLTRADILEPRGYVRLGFTMDGRTGLGPVEDYFFVVLELLLSETAISEILEHPDVRERCRQMELSNTEFLEKLREHSRLEGNVVVTDFRSLEAPPVGNRFMVYTLFPEANVSVRIHWGPRRETVMAVLGHSILNHTCATDLGELAARYGGGGHPQASSIQLIEEADSQVRQIVAELQRNG